MSRRTVSARLGAAVAPRAESPLRLVLAVSPLKGDRMELVVQKATELGVAAIWPVVTFRTDAAARPALQGSRGERWERVASGAAEQCGRAVVPEVAPTTTLDGLVARAFDGAEGRAPRDPRSRAARLARDRRLARRCSCSWARPAASSRPKPRRSCAAGFAAASLGPRILRAETAAVAAVAIAQASWGDLRA